MVLIQLGSGPAALSLNVRKKSLACEDDFVPGLLKKTAILHRDGQGGPSQQHQRFQHPSDLKIPF